MLPAQNADPNSRRPRRRILKLTLFLLALILIFGNLFIFRNPPTPDFINPTHAAAYSNLIAIANQITGDSDSPDRTAFIAQNQAALTAAHAALENPIEAPEANYRRGTIDPMQLSRVKIG